MALSLLSNGRCLKHTAVEACFICNCTHTSPSRHAFPKQLQSWFSRDCLKVDAAPLKSHLWDANRDDWAIISLLSKYAGSQSSRSMGLKSDWLKVTCSTKLFRINYIVLYEFLISALRQCNNNTDYVTSIIISSSSHTNIKPRKALHSQGRRNHGCSGCWRTNFFRIVHVFCIH